MDSAAPADPLGAFAAAADIAASVAMGQVSAREVTEAHLIRIARTNPSINAYTDLLEDRALREADAVDAAVAAGRDPGPLAGVPYAVKNLFDLAGLPTRAGSKINRDREPAAEDADLVQRMGKAGAICLGALNMGEYAYDFTGENAHDDACRNPHDTARMSGGSSSGCGSATAAGLAPVSLGSDTNGSIRVPASLCGIFSLKPTYGRLSRGGSFPFVDSLDHLGPFARHARDLALAYDALQGGAGRDHACAGKPVAPALPGLGDGIKGLRIGRLRGWFAENAGAEADAAASRVTAALAELGGSVSDTELDAAVQGRAAAFLITNAESAAFHLPALRERAHDYDPDTRDRFLAGALMPAAWLQKAHRVRRWWLEQALEAFRTADLMVAPATPCPAPEIGGKILTLGGIDRPLRPYLGLLAQPFSAIGLPVVTVPVFEPGKLPVGIQLIAAPWREDLALRVAETLERAGVAVAHRPKV
jgi:aspartyl-tRNA(Asn)/glutamyl-tRNA(Gln) amidotransferase subunit A